MNVTPLHGLVLAAFVILIAWRLYRRYRSHIGPQKVRPLRMSLRVGLFSVFAVLILIVGSSRVFFGVRGPEFFLTNPWFWAKITAFVVVGILSAPPTIRFIAWRRHAKADAGFAITADDVRWVRRFFIGEIVVFAFIPLFAAAMVRVPFL